MSPHDFLRLLWQHKPEHQYILIWTLQDKRSHWFQDVTQAAECTAAAALYKDVYVGVGLSPSDHGPARRCKSEEISGLCGIGTDLDLHSAAHKKVLPATIPEARKILPAAMPASLLISTGNGIHPWWLFKEPPIFENDMEREAAARLLARWHRLLARNAAAHGWSYDKLSDLARVLRIPGTRNYKDPANPKDVTVLAATEYRYNLSDFEELLDREGIVDTEAQEEAARDWKEQFDNKPLVVDLTRRISQDRIDGWMSGDMRFRNTWLRQRHDLKDQSQSGYDLALACFGMDAGLPEQDIVTLIIHHRSLYARSHRSRLDYFQRTIAKATRVCGGGAGVIACLETPGTATTAAAEETGAAPAMSSPPTGEGAPQGAPVPPGDAQAANAATELPPAEKDALCAKIAGLLKTPIVRLVELDGKDPSFHMRFESGRVIGFRTYEKFTNQQSVRNAIGAATRKIIPRFKPKAWEQLSQWMLDACYIEEPTDEEDLVRGARLHIVNYLLETGFIASIEDQRVQDQRKPIIIPDGRIAVSTLDFLAYMAKTTCQKISQPEAASMLVAVGGTKYRVCGRKYDQIRRALPYPDFDPKEIRPREDRDASAQ